MMKKMTEKDIKTVLAIFRFFNTCSLLNSERFSDLFIGFDFDNYSLKFTETLKNLPVNLTGTG